MLIKHRSQHTCESAIYHNERPEIVKEKCMIRYYTHLNPKPMMIDSGDMLLLGNLPRPWITRCDKNIQIPETLQAGSYVIVYKHELCECSIMAGNPVWKVERNINYCRENTTQIHLYHTVNMAVMIYQFQEEIKTMKLSADTLSPVPIELDPKEPGFYSVKKGEVAKEQNKPLLLEEAMASIEETKYLSSEDYILEMNKMDTWFTESNGAMGFMLVASIVVCFLIPLVILIVVKYFGLRILSIQFEDQRKDKDFDTGIRIIIHTNAIQDIFVSKQFKDRVTQLIFNQLITSEEDNPTTDDLPVTEEERIDLLNKLLEDLPISDEPIVFSLPVKPESTCWNSVLSQQEKEQLLFMAKCGRCDCHHEYPRCEGCDTIRMKAGRCQSCNYNKEEEDFYSSTCGNCFQIHELPNCVECQHYRLKPGRCTNCGTIGPEDINWKDSCLEEKDYEDIMKPIMEQRDEVQQKNSKLYKFYDICPLCRSFYHTAKACVFRKHALYFMEAKEQIQQLTTRITNSQQAGGLLFPTTTFIHS